MKKIIVVFAIMFLVSRCFATEVMPDQLVRTTIEKINLLLKVDRSVDFEDPWRLYAMMDFCEEMLPHIDFRGMSRVALGRYWRDEAEDQRARFTHESRNLLVRIYGTALQKYSDQGYLSAVFGRPGDTTAVVKTVVKSAGRWAERFHQLQFLQGPCYLEGV